MFRSLCLMMGLIGGIALSSYAKDKLPPGVQTSTDKEEWGVSKTTMSVTEENGVIKTVYNVPVPDKKYAYAAISVPLKSLADGKSKALHFELKCSNGATLPSNVVVISASGRKSKLDFAKNEKASLDWKKFDISLADFSLTPNDTNALERLSFSLGVNRAGGKELGGTVELRNIKVTDENIEPMIKIPDYSFLLKNKLRNVAKGHSAWVYPQSEKQINNIIEYNKKASVPISILYVYAGSVKLDKKTGEWTVSEIQPEKMKWFRDRLPGNIEIQANIDSADGVKLSKASPEVQTALGRDLAEKINDCPYVQGVHTDIEPYKTESLPFYIALKQYCKKPVGAALGDWDLHILRILDYPVLMGYDLANSPEGLYKTALKKYNSFAKDSSYAESYYSVGLPFIATMGEFEYEENRKTGERKYSGYKMNEFIDGAFRAFKECDMLNDKYFMGVSIWGFVDEGKKGVGIPSNEMGFFPHIITEDCFEKLRTLKY